MLSCLTGRSARQDVIRAQHDDDAVQRRTVPDDPFYHRKAVLPQDSPSVFPFVEYGISFPRNAVCPPDLRRIARAEIGSWIEPIGIGVAEAENALHFVSPSSSKPAMPASLAEMTGLSVLRLMLVSR